MTSKSRRPRNIVIPISQIRAPEQTEKSKITRPGIPKSVKKAKKTKHFGDLLERPPESNSKLTERSSIPCGPEKQDRVSSFLVEKGFRINRAELLFSLIRRLCKEDDERPIEADDKHVWLGSHPVGIVMSFMDKPTLHIWIDQLITTSYRNGSMEEMEIDIQRIMNNTRALSALVDAFEIPYGLLASTIAENKFAELVANPKSTSLRFYEDRTAHPTRVFRT